MKKKSKGAVPVLVGNTHHIGRRESQQDSFVLSDLGNTALWEERGLFCVVADGMGGLKGGGEISAIVTSTMLQYFTEVDVSGDPALDLLNMLLAASDNVNQYLEGRNRGGSTAVAVIVRDDNLYFVSVGDSRIYLLRGGALLQLTREHTFGVELDEKAAIGIIDWEDAAGNPKRGALTSYLGQRIPEKIDRNLRPIRLVDGDRLLLMSDGVFGVLTEDEMLAAQDGPPHKSAQALTELVLGRNNPNQDNFTAVILEYRGA